MGEQTTCAIALEVHLCSCVRIHLRMYANGPLEQIRSQTNKISKAKQWVWYEAHFQPKIIPATSMFTRHSLGSPRTQMPGVCALYVAGDTCFGDPNCQRPNYHLRVLRNLSRLIVFKIFCFSVPSTWGRLSVQHATVPCDTVLRLPPLNLLFFGN